MSITWSDVASGYGVKAVCSSGSESAPSGATEGIALNVTGAREIGNVSMFYEAAGALTNGGSFKAYVRSHVTGTWCRCAALDVSITEASNNNWASGDFECMPSIDRLAWVPSGVGQAGDLYIFGLPRTR